MACFVDAVGVETWPDLAQRQIGPP